MRRGIALPDPDSYFKQGFKVINLPVC